MPSRRYEPVLHTARQYLRRCPLVPALAVAAAATAVVGTAVALHGGGPQPESPTRFALIGGAVPATAPVTAPTSTVVQNASTTTPISTTPVSRPNESVAPLRALHEPDAVVMLDRSLTAAEVHRLAQLPGATGVTTVDVGTVVVAGVKGLALGVDPSVFRAFTPQVTAASDALWTLVARGELVASYDLHKAHPLPLGGTVSVSANATAPMRVGGVATLGLPGVQVLLDHDRAGHLGLLSGGGVVLSAPSQDPQAFARAVTRVLGPHAKVNLLHPSATLRQPARSVAHSRPRSYQELYRAGARTCHGLSWGVLAGIGQVESGHGRDTSTSSAGAMGPMQFLPSTFAQVAVDGDGDGVADIQDPFDAVYSAARYLCENGGGQGGQSLYNAVFAYNHADWYVDEVLSLAHQYVAKYGG